MDGDAGTGIGRRSYLKFGSTLMVGATLGGLTAGRARADHGVLADPAPAALEVGGGGSYDDSIERSDANYVVGTKTELLDALGAATSGDVVYVEDDVKIDLSETSNIGVRAGVTLASGRGQNGSMGGMLYTNVYPNNLFKVYGDNVRFTGLRIRGARWDYFKTGNYDYYGSRGVWLLGDDCEIDNCQLYGWSHAAVTIGARSYTNSAHIHHSSIHHNRMEGLGYGVDIVNGHSLIEHCYFDHNRHSIDGFGYATNGYEARYNLVGLNPGSHAFDMHCLQENGGGGNRAGGTIKIHHNTFEFTEDYHGRPQEAIAIRGVPKDGAYFEKNWFAHPERPDGTSVSDHGQAYRQENLDTDGWKNIWSAGNRFGEDTEPPSDVGCPRDVKWRPATAVAKADERHRSDVAFDYQNRFHQRMTVTGLEIKPRSKSIVRLADGTYGEGRWESELHIAADVQDGCTDVGGGQTLPGRIDLATDGHSQSPDTEAVLSAGSTASVALTQFRDGNDRPVDVHREVVHFAVHYRLADGTEGVDEFSTVPLGEGKLTYRGDANAVSRGTRRRSGVEFGLENWFDQRLTVTDMRIAPASGRIKQLADHSYGEGRWQSELHVAADVRDGCTDIGGGLDLPGTADFSSDGHSQSPDTEAVLSPGSTASVALWRFDDNRGRAVDMAGRTVDVEVRYRLEDGSTGTAAFEIVPQA